jgi:hypothetical protein
MPVVDRTAAPASRNILICGSRLARSLSSGGASRRPVGLAGTTKIVGFNFQTAKQLRNVSPRSRGATRPGCARSIPSKQRAWGTPGARRTRSLACNKEKHTSIVTTDTPVHPAFPHAMVLTAYFVLSPVIGLSCHRRQRSCPRQLDAGVEASGPHDFAVRGKHLSSARFVIAHGSKPAPRSHRAPDAAASTASRPASVTIAIRPSVGWDSGGYRFDLGHARTEIFLQMGLDC